MSAPVLSRRRPQLKGTVSRDFRLWVWFFCFVFSSNNYFEVVRYSVVPFIYLARDRFNLAEIPTLMLLKVFVCAKGETVFFVPTLVGGVIDSAVLKINDFIVEYLGEFESMFK
jgi:hypothetical protein